MIFDVEQYRYQRFISDLARMDIHPHAGKPCQAVRVTRDWLANVSRRILPSASSIEALHGQFLAELPELAATLGFESNQVPYIDFERIVTGWLSKTMAP